MEIFVFFLLIFTKGIKTKLIELESESEIFPYNEGQSWETELTPLNGP